MRKKKTKEKSKKKETCFEKLEKDAIKETQTMIQDAMVEEGNFKVKIFAQKMLENQQEFEKLQKQTKIPAKTLRKRLHELLEHEDLIETG